MSILFASSLLLLICLRAAHSGCSVLGVDLQVLPMLSPPLLQARLPAPLPCLSMARGGFDSGDGQVTSLPRPAAFPWRVARGSPVYATVRPRCGVCVLQPVALTLCLAYCPHVVGSQPAGSKLVLCFLPFGLVVHGLTLSGQSIVVLASAGPVQANLAPAD